MRLIVHGASVANVEGLAPKFKPGQVAVANGQQLIVQTGNGLLSIDRIQPAGKRVMPVEDFLRGNPPVAGDFFR